VDMDVRWNSTFLMLKHLVPYRGTFSVWIKTNHPCKEDGSILINDDHWYIIEKMLSFLQDFYDSNVALSGVYYPTSPLMLHHILKIARQLNAFENDRLLREAIVPMKSKFLKYWRDIPILYAFAFVLDPRANTTGHSSFAECRRHSAKAILPSAKALPSVTLGKERSTNCTSATASLPSTFCRALGKEFAECHLTLGKEKSPSRRQLTVTDPLPSVFFSTRQKG
jgi:hypothetical protein